VGLMETLRHEMKPFGVNVAMVHASQDHQAVQS
jgi:hypothetical protein